MTNFLLELPSDNSNIPRSEWDPFYDFLRSCTGWFLLAKYLIAILPMGIQFGVRATRNQNSGNDLLSGINVRNLIYILIVNYGLTIPSDLYLAIVSSRTSKGDIQRYNFMYRITSIMGMVWNISLFTVVVIGFYGFLNNAELLGPWNLDMTTSILATTFSMIATASFGQYVEWNMSI